jgi:hypothetical protein
LESQLAAMREERDGYRTMYEKLEETYARSVRAQQQEEKPV